MTGVPETGQFERLAMALEPWLSQVVIVGGWAHQLYRSHPLAQELDYPPLRTLDADVAVPERLAPLDSDIRARLLAYGFTEERLGDVRPPATHYRLSQPDSGFYAEFLTPLTGGEHDRTHQRKATVDIAGVVLQRLRYIDLLLFHPWQVNFRRLSSPRRFRSQTP